jgi:Flp pilus assembly pilin Flp
MSDVFHAINDTSMVMTVRTQNAVREWVHAAVARMGSERGQTAAEYLGVLVVVSVIIAAVATTDVGDKIKGFVNDIVGKISHGDSAKGA